MDITEEIIKKLGLIGYPWKVSIVLKYFLDENIKSLYGTSNMSYEDIDFTITSNSINLESIFLDGHCIIYVDFDRTSNVCTIKCDKVVDDKTTRVFEIIDKPASIKNIVIAEDGIQKKYIYEKSIVSFGFEVSHVEGENQVIDYRGTLNPIYSKIKNIDWFDYTQEYPPKVKEKSILKRIVDELSGRGNSRQVLTSEDATIELEEFSDRIFGTLIKEAQTILQSNENSDKKRIRI